MESPTTWYMFGKKFPKSEIAYFSQVIIIYLVIITCIVNLSIKNGDSNLWTALLSSCLGYILPAPKIKTPSNGHHIGPVPE
jgi:hypothetical protein